MKKQYLHCTKAGPIYKDFKRQKLSPLVWYNIGCLIGALSFALGWFLGTR